MNPCATKSSRTVLALASAIFIFAAWRFPGQTLGALLGWVAALLLCLAVWGAEKKDSAPPYGIVYSCGIFLNLLGFYWLFSTISRFGGFGTIPTCLLFGLFLAISALQYPLFLFMFRFLPLIVDGIAARTALAWISAELLAVRIFPWQLAHTQLGFAPFAQIAELGGSLLVSFMLVWVSETILRCWRKETRTPGLLVPIAIFAGCIIFGVRRVEQFSEPPGRALKVALVQANITLEEKGNVEYFSANEARYVELTRSIADPERLVIWPETVIQNWVAVNTLSIENDPRLPRFDPPRNLLTGALTFQSQSEFFNSALAIYDDGNIPTPSHKQILMPFGEYTPLSEFLPWLSTLNRNVANFTPGKKIEVFSFPVPESRQGEPPARVSALICYEDIIPHLARDATRNGAELLVNLTNDAWFGTGPAATHHNLIASFRAIENRRYLLRSTNSGLTAIINPLGETVSHLEPFSEGTLLATVHLMSYKTLYTQWIGDRPWWCLSVCILMFSLYGARGYKSARRV